MSTFKPDYLPRLLLRRMVKKYAWMLTGHILDIGCGQKPYERYIRGNVVGIDWLSSNFKGRTSADVIGSVEYLPIDTGGADSVISTQLMEYVSDPALLFEESARILRQHGIVLLSCPSLFPLHGRRDYLRLTYNAFQWYAKRNGFKQIALEPTSGFVTSSITHFLFWMNHRVLRAKVLYNPINLILNLIGLCFLWQRDEYFTMDNVFVGRKI